jgi:prepilin-type N-terminal cleavage/methylation domain-containing protein
MSSDRGFSLLEVLIATTIFAVGLLALAQLFALSITATTTAKTATMAALLGMEKMEQLRSLAWGGLATSPSGVLTRNVSGFCDFVGADGQSLGEATAPPPGAAYLRRWSVEPLPADTANALVLQVRVTRWVNRAIDTIPPARDEANLLAVRTRRGL